MLRLWFIMIRKGVVMIGKEVIIMSISENYHDILTNVPAISEFFMVCLRDNLLDPWKVAGFACTQ